MAIDTHTGILSTDDGLKYFDAEREAAFFGLLQAYGEVTRALELALAQAHGISLAGYEVLNRLAQAPDGQLRMGDLASRTPLSVSRISRVVDDLASRSMVERRSCDSDRRVSYATLLDPGREFLREAQETFYAAAEERFLGRLSARELKVLATAFGRITEGSGCRENLSAAP